MKIVHCFFSMKVGGAQLLCVDILNSLSQDNQVYLIVLNDQFDLNVVSLVDKSVQIIYINRIPGSTSIFPIIGFNKALYEIKPDIIHYHEHNLVNLTFYPLAKKILTVHDVNVPTRFLNMYDALISISNSVHQDIVYRKKCKPVLIKNGVNTFAYKRRTNFDFYINDEFKIIQVSRLVHQKKGQDVLLKAISELVVSQKIPNVSVDFVGSGDSLDWLINLVDTLGLNAHVNFVGEKDKAWLYNNLCKYHMLVQPSIYEGFGLTIVEGLSAGLPVLSSNVDGPFEILSDMPSGELFFSSDHVNCAKKIEEVFFKYLDRQIETLVIKSLQIVNDKYSLTSMISGYVRLYETIL